METVNGWRGRIVVEHASGMQREPLFHRAQRVNFVFSAPEMLRPFALSTKSVQSQVLFIFEFESWR